MASPSRAVLLPALILIGAGSVAEAQESSDSGSPLKVEVHGLIASTFFLQDNSFGFGNGQNATFVADRARTEDPWMLGGDVRNSRVRMDLTGLTVEGSWTASAHLEVDFFGGFNGSGPFSDEQAQLRLRSAYVDLRNGGTRIRIGQAFAPLLGNIPASVSHLAFPLGYGSAGVVGWRHPGLFLSQRLRTSDRLSADLQLAALRGSWTGPGDNLEQESAGETAAFPQLEARLDLRGSAGEELRWSAYSVAHVDRKDLSGLQPPNGGRDRLEGRALEAGGRLDFRQLTIHGNGYRGRAIGQQLGQLTQFGDIRSQGAWAQVGYHLTSTWSAWLFRGTEDPDDGDLLASGGTTRLKNDSWAFMARFASGPLSIGFEWMGTVTDWGEEGADVRRRKGNQLSLSAVYQF